MMSEQNLRFEKIIDIEIGMLLLLRVMEAFCPRRRPHSGPIEL